MLRRIANLSQLRSLVLRKRATSLSQLTNLVLRRTISFLTFDV